MTVSANNDHTNRLWDWKKGEVMTTPMRGNDSLAECQGYKGIAPQEFGVIWNPWMELDRNGGVEERSPPAFAEAYAEGGAWVDALHLGAVLVVACGAVVFQVVCVGGVAELHLPPRTALARIRLHHRGCQARVVLEVRATQHAGAREEGPRLRRGGHTAGRVPRMLPAVWARADWRRGRQDLPVAKEQRARSIPGRCAGPGRQDN
jgi:hypothetical protein